MINYLQIKGGLTRQFPRTLVDSLVTRETLGAERVKHPESQGLGGPLAPQTVIAGKKRGHRTRISVGDFPEVLVAPPPQGDGDDIAAARLAPGNHGHPQHLTEFSGTRIVVAVRSAEQRLARSQSGTIATAYHDFAQSIPIEFGRGDLGSATPENHIVLADRNPIGRAAFFHSRCENIFAASDGLFFVAFGYGNCVAQLGLFEAEGFTGHNGHAVEFPQLHKVRHD